MTVRRTLAYSFFACGLLLGGLGTYNENTTHARLGLMSALLSIPLYVRMYCQLRDEERQQAETAGYMRALDHVARGLLDQNHDGEPGPGETLAELPDNVIPLNADVPAWPDDGHRKESAQ